MEKGYKKASWETKFEEFRDNGVNTSKTLTDKIKSLVAEMNSNPTDTRVKELNEEIKIASEQLKGIKKIEKNNEKLLNILQVKNDLVQESYDLVRALEVLNDKTIYTNVNDTINDLDSELKTLNTELASIEEELRKDNLDEDKKQELQKEKEEKLNHIKENNFNYSFLTNIKDGKLNKLEVINRLSQNEQLIAKCDLIGANLIKGKSMEDITASLKNFKFTPNKDFAKNIKEARKLKEQEKEKRKDNSLKDPNKGRKNIVQEEERLKKLVDETQRKLDEAKSKYQDLQDENSLTKIDENAWYNKIWGIKHITKLVRYIRDRKEREEREGKITSLEKDIETLERKVQGYEAMRQHVIKESERVSKSAPEVVDENHSIEYLKAIRKRNDVDQVLTGMAVYGRETFDKLGYRVPIINTNEDTIKKLRNDAARKSAYGSNKDIETRKIEIKERVAEMKAAKNGGLTAAIKKQQGTVEKFSHTDEGR